MSCWKIRKNYSMKLTISREIKNNCLKKYPKPNSCLTLKNNSNSNISLSSNKNNPKTNNLRPLSTTSWSKRKEPSSLSLTNPNKSSILKAILSKWKEKKTSSRKKTRRIKNLLSNSKIQSRNSARTSRISKPCSEKKGPTPTNSLKSLRKEKNNSPSSLNNWLNLKKNTKNSPIRQPNKLDSSSLKWTKNIQAIWFQKRKTIKKF